MQTASDQVLVRLTPSTTRALDEHRIQERPVRSRGAIVRRAVEEYLKRQGEREPVASPASVAPTRSWR